MSGGKLSTDKYVWQLLITTRWVSLKFILKPLDKYPYNFGGTWETCMASFGVFLYSFFPVKLVLY